MEQIKKHDFIEIEYTGTTKGDNAVFDTTDEKAAKENNLNGPEVFGPVIVCVGEQQILKGLDNSLEGKEVGKEYTIAINPEDGFGNKNAKLIQMVPINKFLQQKIQPMPGMQLNIDGVLGTIKTVSGGRTLVDFNHPLAGKELSYTIKINRKVEDAREKLIGYLKLSFGIKDIEAEVKEGRAKVSINLDLPQELQQEFSGKITKLINDITAVEFIAKNGNPSVS